MSKNLTKKLLEGPKTYPVKRGDGRTVQVTVPPKEPIAEPPARSYAPLKTKTSARIRRAAASILNEMVGSSTLGDTAVEIANEFSGLLPEDNGAYEDFTADVELWLREEIARQIVKY